MTILFDTNVIIDIFQVREPFFEDSYKALKSKEIAMENIERISMLVTFADVLGIDIHTAMESSLADFEDAVVDAVAERNNASYIVTRNIKDFVGSDVPAITPTDFIDKSIEL